MSRPNEMTPRHPLLEQMGKALARGDVINADNLVEKNGMLTGHHKVRLLRLLSHIPMSFQTTVTR